MCDDIDVLNGTLLLKITLEDRELAKTKHIHDKNNRTQQKEPHAAAGSAGGTERSQRCGPCHRRTALARGQPSLCRLGKGDGVLGRENEVRIVCHEYHFAEVWPDTTARGNGIIEPTESVQRAANVIRRTLLLS